MIRKDQCSQPFFLKKVTFSCGNFSINVHMEVSLGLQQKSFVFPWQKKVIFLIFMYCCGSRQGSQKIVAPISNIAHLRGKFHSCYCQKVTAFRSFETICCVLVEK